jgi:hypothetical protein
MAWHAPHEGRSGRPPVFSNAAIQFCLSIKVLLKLPLRQTAGMVASLLRLAGLDWPVPDYSTLSRRQKTLKVQIPYRRAGGPLNLLVPSRALLRNTLPGDGQHRYQVPRRWRVASPEAWCSGATPMAQGPSGHGHRHIRHPRGRVQPQPGRRQPRPARPAGADPGRRRHRHRDRRWCL